MRKRPGGYHVDHPVVRGQRHQQATFGLAARVCGFAWERSQGRPHIRHEAGVCVVVGRQYGCLAVSRFFIRPSGRTSRKGRGRPLILEDRRSRPNSFGASTRYERAVADIDRRAVSAPDAATTTADLLAAASRAWGTAASSPLCPEIAGRSTRTAPSCQTGRAHRRCTLFDDGQPSLSASVEDPAFIPADMSEDVTAPCERDVGQRLR